MNVLPQPFAWISIPSGEVQLLIDTAWKNHGHPDYVPNWTSKCFEVRAFEIAKYPLTNAQFTPFIEEKGYHQPRWWTDEGWEAKEQYQWLEPLYWNDTKWNKPDFLVIGVSWHEAFAYCNWLSDKAEKSISLPTEQQWQRAAQGDSSRIYAWGDVYEEGRCNWGTDGTTSVTQYEGKGDSPYRVVDLTGNVWEWCLTKYETLDHDTNGSEIRVARGGGWEMLYSYTLNLRTTDRMPLAPLHRLEYLGFRCACI
jgi:formylglycine-generating enzyme required for sulfatase activity